MSDVALTLCLINFGYIALLPRKFFKRGSKLTLGWWATAWPLFAMPALIALHYWGWLPTLLHVDKETALLLPVLSVFSVVFSTLSLVVVGFTVGTHRVPIYMFHDKEDSGQTKHLVTWGPYQWIRHPLYASYVYALIAAFMYAPSIPTFLTLAYGYVALNMTASKEEKRLCGHDEFGDEYRDYIKNTGRFWPPLAPIFRYTGFGSSAQRQAQQAAESEQTPAANVSNTQPTASANPQ